MTVEGVSMRIVVTGAAGRLGAVIARDMAAAGHAVTALTRADLDISHTHVVGAMMRALRPDVIVNCSAYNAVDQAERDHAAAFEANAYGPATLAGAAAEVGALLVHYSTDFVFDGRASEPYDEDAPVNPLNVYGASKLAGEEEVRRLRGHYILRVESLFGGWDVNGPRPTVDYIADSLSAGQPVRAIVDRTVSPSYVQDVVRATRALLERNAPFGTYHCVATGSTTWYELAHEIARFLHAVGPILPVKAADFPATAARPRFCALSNQKLLALGIEMPSWRTALRRHLASRPQLARSEPDRRVRIA